MTDSKTTMFVFQLTYWKGNTKKSAWIAAPFKNKKAADTWKDTMHKNLKEAQKKQFSGRLKPHVSFTSKGEERKRHKDTIVIHAPVFMSVTAIINLVEK